MFPLVPLSSDLIRDADSFLSLTGLLAYEVSSTTAIGTLVAEIKTVFEKCQLDILILDRSAVLTVDAAIQILDAGAAKIGAGSDLLSQLVEAGVSVDRLFEIEAVSGNYSGALVDSALQTKPSYTKEFVTFTFNPELKDAVLLVAAKSISESQLAEAVTARLTSDRPDGLYTTLVVDQSDRCLGLVYSSDESVSEAVRTQTGVYQSRKHGLWYKGKTSGAVQNLLRIELDCDTDCLKFVVVQQGAGFCHLNRTSCFGEASGVAGLEKVLAARKQAAPPGSYTARLFNDPDLLRAKIMEEAEELCDAATPQEVAWEAADLLYFLSTKLAQTGVSWAQVEANLDAKARKISRRKGDAKPKWVQKEDKKEDKKNDDTIEQTSSRISMRRLDVATATAAQLSQAMARPAQKTSDIMKLVTPIIDDVRARGDQALIDLTAKFDKAQLSSPIIKAPFPASLMEVSVDVKKAIDVSIANVAKFHSAQVSDKPLVVETAPGVVCSRFARPIESVGLYIPGGSAVLPSTAIMLGVPAKVAGCHNIVVASPPRADGTPTPEVVYIADKIGASCIVLAGGAQAVAAMAYGTQSVPKVNKIMGPGNQFVTAAKMFVQNDTAALVAIDMPAGPSEVLVVADSKANPAFVASDLLSQAEHGPDSQVVLIAVDLDDHQLEAIENELHSQAMALPRVNIIRQSIYHSTTLKVKTVQQALELSNRYAPEHLILQVEDAASLVPLVQNAGSVFVGALSPESCGDYSSGTNHTLPTYGYAKMYSGVNTQTFQKHITSQELTKEGLQSIGEAVMTLAAAEGLDAHRMAVKIRMEALGL